jgi:glucosyl-3-phosphoglycerate synthase
MQAIDHYEAADFSPEKVRELKGERKLFVVFSTCGEREADLIHHKVKLIRDELGDFVDGIFLSHRRSGDEADRTERLAREADPYIKILLNNSSCPPDMEDETGKGSDMRRALYQMNLEFVNGTGPSDIVVVFLDSDVLPEYFGSHFVTGLAGPVLAGYDFAKASFWRAMGRVKKFVAQPLFSLIDHPKIAKLTDLSYPLSGEVAGTLEFFNSVCFWQVYGVETGINIETCFGPYRVADVNLGLYDHRHQSDLNIQKMSFGILRTFFLQLIENGIIRLEDGAKVSDVFRVSFIDSDGMRRRMEFNLPEKKYQPLRNVLPPDDFQSIYPFSADERKASMK